MLTRPRRCRAAFEATRFYNVSENSPLARELCDGPTCNEVESSNNQWTGEPLIQTSHPPYLGWPLQTFLFCFFAQDSSRPISATTCLVVWRSSSLNVVRATGTAVTTGNQCAARMGSSTKTCVRWRCLRAETGRASSKSRHPSVLMVRNEQPIRGEKAVI